MIISGVEEQEMKERERRMEKNQDMKDIVTVASGELESDGGNVKDCHRLGKCNKEKATPVEVRFNGVKHVETIMNRKCNPGEKGRFKRS